MMTTVTIDLNCRINGTDTYSGLEDSDGPLAAGQVVRVWEPESDIAGTAVVTLVDLPRRLVFMSVDWAGLRRVPESVRETFDRADSLADKLDEFGETALGVPVEVRVRPRTGLRMYEGGQEWLPVEPWGNY